MQRLWIATLLWMLSPLASQAATFTVTEQSCGGGAGTLSQAVRDANSNPGADVIEITPGLILDASCDMGTLSDDPGLFILDSVTIRGQDSTLHGNNTYIASSNGAVNELDTAGRCPSSPSSNYLVTGVSPGLFQVGQRNVDNSGIELIVEDLKIKQLSQVASVRDGAKGTLRNVEAFDIRDLEQCSRAVVAAYGDADVTLENVTIRQSTDFENVIPSGVILGEDGTLEIYDSNFSRNPSRFAVFWGGDADIVSSFFSSSGGLRLSGAGTMQVINSLFLPAEQEFGRRYQDGFLVDGNGSLRFEASTVVYEVNDCPPFPALDCNWDGSQPSNAAFQARAGSIDLEQSAIHVKTIDPLFNLNQTLILEEVGGDITADDLTFIQSVDWQNTAALEAITTPPTALVAGSDALPVATTGAGFLQFRFPESVTPIITGNALLVDRVTNAGVGGANELLDGRGATITEDVLGAPRTVGGLRNIGAVQNDLVPGLLALIDPPTPFTARLFWNQPNSVGITGYDLCQGTGPAPTGLERTTDPCPGTLTEPYTTSAGTTVGVLPNLPPSNVNHWFAVRAVAGANKEPWSNVSNVVVPVTVSYPTETVGPMTNIAPTVTGPTTGISFLLQSGTLPAGLSLNPTTGVIAGTVSGSCTAQTLQILVVSGGGGLSSAPATISCPVRPVPALKPWHLVPLVLSLALLAGWIGQRRRVISG